MKHGAPVKPRPWLTVCIAFLTSLLVFVALMLASDLTDDRSEQPVEVDSTAGKERTLTVFFHGGDDELTGVVTVTTDTRTMSVQVTAYPVTSVLQNGYAEGKTDYARMFFNREQRVESDAALSFSVKSISDFLEYAGDRLTVTLPEPAIGLSAGESTLTYDQLTELLRYNGWSTGETGRQRFYAQTVAWMIDRFLVPSRNIDADFSKLTELCDDRLHISQFAAIREELIALSLENDGDLCRERVQN